MIGGARDRRNLHAKIAIHSLSLSHSPGAIPPQQPQPKTKNLSHRQPVRAADRHAFDVVIDARAPSEFALDHIPGAINCPALDDEERRIVGTLYKQQGSFEARRVGGAMVAANLAKYLKEQWADKPENWKPLVYCWRGGLRSGSMVSWMRLVGWDAQQLAGGYKNFRQHVVQQMETLCPTLDLRVIVGATGSAKTRVLQALALLGVQVLDLEDFANHKGSLLGALPGKPQPSQKRFDTRLVDTLEAMDPSRPIYVEGESVRIGRISLPLTLVTRMRASACFEIAATPEARLAYLLRDYAYLGDDPDDFAARLGQLKELQGKETVQRWQAWAHEGALKPLFAELMSMHYDPHYTKSQERNFVQWGKRVSLPAGDLSDASIALLAAQVLALG
jgi:tRNA 2-selenouridine synthase